MLLCLSWHGLDYWIATLLQNGSRKMRAQKPLYIIRQFVYFSAVSIFYMRIIKRVLTCDDCHSEFLDLSFWSKMNEVFFIQNCANTCKQFKWANKMTKCSTLKCNEIYSKTIANSCIFHQQLVVYFEWRIKYSIERKKQTVIPINGIINYESVTSAHTKLFIVYVTYSKYENWLTYSWMFNNICEEEVKRANEIDLEKNAVPKVLKCNLLVCYWTIGIK